MNDVTPAPCGSQMHAEQLEERINHLAENLSELSFRLSARIDSLERVNNELRAQKTSNYYTGHAPAATAEPAAPVVTETNGL